MAYNPKKHHRRSIRLKGYDYSQEGLYFVTICCQNRKCLFGKIVGANPCGRPNGDTPNNEGQPQGIAPTGIARTEMKLNDAGEMVESEWLALPQRFTNIKLHEYAIMPNHFHAILEIVGATVGVAPIVVAQNDINTEKGQPQGIAPTDIAPAGKTLGDMVGAFQSITTVKYIHGVKTKNWKRFDGKLWQRNYWEHIIRNEKSFDNISNYILNNPQNWDGDKFFTS